MTIKKKENIGWIDLLRIVACFLVILSHSCDPFTAQAETDHEAFLAGVFSGSLVRCSVPLFAMMTGVLLLPIFTDMKSFYKKRIGRIIPPLIFWSIVLPILFFTYLNYCVSTTNPAVPSDDHTLSLTLTKLYTFIFNFNFDTIPLWYLYMLMGLYLVMPIISVWLKQASKGEVKLVLYIWGVSLFLPYIKFFAPLLGYAGNFDNMGILGVCSWNDYGTFYYFSGFIGYLILAYYLVKYPLSWSWKRTLTISVPMFLAGYLITTLGYLEMYSRFPGNYVNLEIIWYFAGINVFLMTFPVFVIVQKLKVPSSALLSRMASLSFGIYLCHFIFVQVAYDFFDKILPIPAPVRILGIACLTFGMSYVVIRVMSRFRLTRRFIA